MNKLKYLLFSLLGASGIFTSCDIISPEEPLSEEILAEPIENLTHAQMLAHIMGDEDFARLMSADDGLGPIFVAPSCETCHIGDGKGHPATALTRFGFWNGTSFDPFDSLGGPQLQHRSISGYEPETVPAGANGVTKFIAPNVTGLGYLEEIHDSSIIALRDLQALTPDGITGEISWVSPPDFFSPKSKHISQGDSLYIGRYGRKSGAIDLLQQVVGAYKNDMGITSDYDPVDLYNPLVGVGGDPVADPEVSGSIVDNVVFYIKTLKAPTRRNENDADVLAGQQKFETIGCATCHNPSFTTGPSEVTALSNVTFYPYTDLLLHDMGSELNDNYTEGVALPEEWRTTPLWGLGLSHTAQGQVAYYLHDGRATTLDQAIQFHGGEASNSRAAYNALSQTEKDQLIKFLESL